MIQYELIKRAPRLLRWYRTRLTMDWPRLEAYFPVQGRLLDVGCGIGSLGYELARSRPLLEVLGIDISAENIAFARKYHALPNAKFACARVEAIGGPFNCVLLADVLHHVPPQEHATLLASCAALLAPDGFLLIKDIERRGGQVSWLLDRYVSGCDEVYLQNCSEVDAVVSRLFSSKNSEVHFRVPFPHYYIKAAHPYGTTA